MKLAELKPSFLFLVKFLGFYLMVNLLYGYWVTIYEPRPDPATRSATDQSVFLLSCMGYDVASQTHASSPAERVLLDGHSILSVYEGCNGINVWIIFTGFMLAVARPDRKWLIFWLVGTALIHVANLGRIVALFFISLKYPEALYFVHKYLFTACLYAVVFGLWYLWIARYGGKKSKSA